jgi:hypothetical protein
MNIYASWLESGTANKIQYACQPALIVSTFLKSWAENSFEAKFEVNRRVCHVRLTMCILGNGEGRAGELLLKERTFKRNYIGTQ